MHPSQKTSLLFAHRGFEKGLFFLRGAWPVRTYFLLLPTETFRAAAGFRRLRGDGVH